VSVRTCFTVEKFREFEFKQEAIYNHFYFTNCVHKSLLRNMWMANLRRSAFSVRSMLYCKLLSHLEESWTKQSNMARTDSEIKTFRNKQ